MIRQKITSIVIHRHKQEKVTAQANDATFFVKANNEIQQIIDAFTFFDEESGSKLSKEKTTMLVLGK